MCEEKLLQGKKITLSLTAVFLDTTGVQLFYCFISYYFIFSLRHRLSDPSKNSRKLLYRKCSQQCAIFSTQLYQSIRHGGK